MVAAPAPSGTAGRHPPAAASGTEPGRPGEPVTAPPGPLRWAPFGLLLVSVALSWITSPGLIEPERMRWALVLSAVLALVRGAAELGHARLRVASRPAVAGYLVHLLLLSVGVALNPFLCIYAFLGYVDADRFLGERLGIPGVVVTGLVCGFGQVGGIPGVSVSPGLFVILAAVNVTLALIMRQLGVSRDREIAAREATLAELARAHEQNLALQRQLLDQARSAGVAEERSRLSRELHDTVAQGLVGVIRQLETLAPHLDPDPRARVTRAERAVRDCLTEARRAVRALGPQQLEGAGLVDAVRAVVQNWSLTHGGTATVHVEGRPAGGAHDDVVLRVLQEALANVARHSGATTATVTLSWLGDELIVDIRDDGRGFDPAVATRGRGLSIMAERARAAGGRLVVESSPGDGTTVSAAVPR